MTVFFVPYCGQISSVDCSLLYIVCIVVSANGNLDTNYTYQLFVTKNPDWDVPDIQQLLEQSFDETKLRLGKVREVDRSHYTNCDQIYPIGIFQESAKAVTWHVWKRALGLKNGDLRKWVFVEFLAKNSISHLELGKWEIKGNHKNQGNVWASNQGKWHGRLAGMPVLPGDFTNRHGFSVRV